MGIIKKISRFLRESINFQEEYKLDKRFPWTPVIAEKIKKIDEKINSIKEDFDWGGEDLSSFKINLLKTEWPDLEKLSREHGKSTKQLDWLWMDFLSTSLEKYTSDFFEEFDFFESWEKKGKSGELLIIKTKEKIKNLISYPEEIISDTLYWLNSLTESSKLTDEYIEKILQIKNNRKVKLLSVLGFFEEFESIKKESDSCITKLEKILKISEKIEKSLQYIKEDIKNFIKNTGKNFEEHIKKYDGL
jgi:hypothetical protein